MVQQTPCVCTDPRLLGESVSHRLQKINKHALINKAHHFWPAQIILFENVQNTASLTCKLFTIVLRELFIFLCYWARRPIPEKSTCIFKGLFWITHNAPLSVEPEGRVVGICSSNRHEVSQQQHMLIPSICSLVPSHVTLQVTVSQSVLVQGQGASKCTVGYLTFWRTFDWNPSLEPKTWV